MIVGLMGAPGTGKSYFLARKAWEELAQGRDVYSNFNYDFELSVSCLGAREPWRGETRQQVQDSMGRWFPIRSYQELCSVSSGVLLFDEAHLWAFSRNYRELPFELVFWWSQSRKRGVDVYFAAQRWESVDTMLRELAHYRFRCARFLKGFAYRIEDPRVEKKLAKVGWRRLAFDPVIASLYNTMEILPPPGWGEQPPPAAAGGRRRGRAVSAGYYGERRGEQDGDQRRLAGRRNP